MKQICFLNTALCFILLAAMLFTGCHKGNPSVDPTQSASPSAAQDDDTAKYQLGPNGAFEDEYITANWYPTLSLTRVVMNFAEYSGTTEDGEKLLFSYTVDDLGSFDEELGGHDKDSYQELLFSQNSYYYLDEFSYEKVDGHTALRALYRYAPAEEPDKVVYILQYAYNVNGWIMSMAYTSLSPLPAECEETLKTVKFKKGY